MKKLLLIFTILLTNIFANEEVKTNPPGIEYIKSDEMSIKTNGAKIYFGTPVKVVKKGKDSSKVLIKGVINPDEPNKLYATTNYKVLLVESDKLKKDKENASIELEVSNKNIEKDPEIAWEDSGDIFYDKCTRCHAAHPPLEFDMLTWEALFQSMKSRANPTPHQEAMILRYLYSHAIDGFVVEVDE